MALERKKRSLEEQKSIIDKKVVKERDRIQEKIDELESLKEEIGELRTKDSYSLEEKAEYFDKIFDFAQGCLDELIEDGESNDDNDNCAFELVLEIFGKKIWDVWNNLDR